MRPVESPPGNFAPTCRGGSGKAVVMTATQTYTVKINPVTQSRYAMRPPNSGNKNSVNNLPKRVKLWLYYGLCLLVEMPP